VRGADRRISCVSATPSGATESRAVSLTINVR
jgi:hypothetical protein